MRQQETGIMCRLKTPPLITGSDNVAERNEKASTAAVAAATTKNNKDMFLMLVLHYVLATLLGGKR